MNNFLQKPRGTIDNYGAELSIYESVLKTIEKIAINFGLEKIKTPTFENKNVFIRSLGTETELVKKEFFELLSYHEDSAFVLRPENTASVIRAVANNKLLHTNTLPLRLYYLGSMFRYERPQAGRLREFTQFGIEYIGTDDYLNDIEVILLCNQIITKLNLNSKTKLKLNYLGNSETKVLWNEQLKIYFQKHYHLLSSINQNRVATNPIRILDDKNDAHLDCVINAPKIQEFLTDKENQKFQKICEQLKALKIDFEIDYKLVRGFDYYTGLVFEYVYEGDALKGQSTLIGGGRYHNLLSEFGQENLGCIGMAVGIERLIIALKDNKTAFNLKTKIDVYLANLTFEIDSKIISLIDHLRFHNLTCHTNWKYLKLDKHFKYLKNYENSIVLIYGPKEQAKNEVILKCQKINFQATFNLDNWDEILKIINQIKKDL